MAFGSDMFGHYVGTLEIATMTSLGCQDCDTPEFQAKLEQLHQVPCVLKRIPASCP